MPYLPKRISHLLLRLFLVAASFMGAEAQTPCFNFIGDSVGCAPFTVRVQNCAVGTTSAFYFKDFQGNPGTTRNVDNSGIDTFTYTVPGRYELRQGVVSGSGNLFLSKFVVVLPPDKPVFNVQPCRDSIVTVNMQVIPGDKMVIRFSSLDSITTEPFTSNTASIQYRYSKASSPVNIKVASFYRCALPNDTNIALVGQVSNPDTILIEANPDAGNALFTVIDRQAAKLQYKFYQDINNIRTAELSTQAIGSNQFRVVNRVADTLPCYKIFVYDFCDSLIDSHQVCHQSLRGTALQERNRLEWTEFKSLNYLRYQLNRDGSSIFSVAKQTDSLHEDADVRCGVNYCYRLLTDYNNDSIIATKYPRRLPYIRAISNDVCLRAVSDRLPDPLAWVSPSGLTDGNVVINWQQPQNSTFKDFEVFRLNQANITKQYPVGRITGFAIGDTVPPIADSVFCYQVRYTDSCDNPSAYSNRFCMVRLQLLEQTNTSVSFAWNDFEGWPSGVSNYVMEILDPNNAVIESINRGQNIDFIDDGEAENQPFIKYRVRVNPRDPNIRISYSNTITVRVRSSLQIPTAFSPNNDGKNDFLRPVYRRIKSLNMEVYNRWGQIIYQDNTLDAAWDGTYRNRPSEPGAYVCHITAIDELGQTIELREAVMLVR